MLSIFGAKSSSDARSAKAIVRCEDDYERATQRIAELGTPAAGSEEESELFGLVEAVEKWDARHDDATGWE